MRRILLILICALTALGISAHYSIHSFTNGVKIESAGKSVAPTKGLQVKATDYVIIPQGGKVEIFNDVDKRVYTSIKSGKISVTKLMIDARGAAADNNSNVISKLQFGKSKSGNEGKNIYVEKGMVRRSLAVYDPEADNVEMDGKTLGGFVAAAIRAGKVSGVESPVKLDSRTLEGGGKSFRVENTLEYPVYFNIIKLGSGNSSTAEISRLGQPAGSYVVLPGQSLSREHFPALPAGERHILIMTRCQYDIDEVIERINEELAADGVSEVGGDLPVFITELK